MSNEEPTLGPREILAALKEIERKLDAAFSQAFPAPKPLTVAEFSQRIGRSPQFVRERIRARQIAKAPGSRGKWLIPASELSRFTK